MSATAHTTYQDDSEKYGIAEPVSMLRAQSQGLLAVSIVFFLTTWISTGLRFYVRTQIQKRFGIDDWLMIATMILFTVYVGMCATFAKWVLDSDSAYANGAIPANSLFPLLMCVAYCVYIATMIAFRLALGFYFLNFFHVYRTRRAVIWITVVSSTLFSVLDIIWTIVYPCQLQMLFFLGIPSCDGQPTRVDWEVITAIWSFLTAASDITFAVLSVLAISRMQLSFRMKVQGAILCAFGSIGGLASLVRFVLLIVKWPDASILGQSIHFTIWSVIEPGLGATAASLATLRPLATKIKNSTFGSNQISRPTQNIVAHKNTGNSSIVQVELLPWSALDT